MKPILTQDLAFSYPHLRRLQEVGMKTMEVADETAREEEACLQRMLEHLSELPSDVDVSHFKQVLRERQGTVWTPRYEEVKSRLQLRIDQLIENITRIDRSGMERFEELCRRADRLAWKHHSLISMLGPGTHQISDEAFRSRLNQVRELAEVEDIHKYLQVQDGAFVYLWEALAKRMDRKKIGAAEEAILQAILRQIRQDSIPSQRLAYEAFVMTMARAGQLEWLEAYRQKWAVEGTLMERILAGYGLFCEALEQAPYRLLVEDIAVLSQSEITEENLAVLSAKIQLLLQQYGGQQGVSALSLLQSEEIASCLQENPQLWEEVLGQIGRLQIEQDIADRAALLRANGLSNVIDDYESRWLRFEGKNYVKVMPYYGEIPGYTYMEITMKSHGWGNDPYVYTLEYVSNDKAKIQEFVNQAVVTNDVIQNVAVPIYMAISYTKSQSAAMANGAKQIPVAGDPDFIGPPLPKAGDPNFIGPSLPKAGDPNFIGPSLPNEGPGDIRYRIGEAVEPLDKTLDHYLNPEGYIQEIVDKYGINLKGSGQKITIKYDPDYIKGPGYVSELYPNTIILGPEALCSEVELANTIAHELNHWRDWLKGGIAPEPPAYNAGDSLADYINGGR